MKKNLYFLLCLITLSINIQCAQGAVTKKEHDSQESTTTTMTPQEWANAARKGNGIFLAMLPNETPMIAGQNVPPNNLLLATRHLLEPDTSDTALTLPSHSQPLPLSQAIPQAIATRSGHFIAWAHRPNGDSHLTYHGSMGSTSLQLSPSQTAALLSCMLPRIERPRGPHPRVEELDQDQPPTSSRAIKAKVIE